MKHVQVLTLDKVKVEGEWKTELKKLKTEFEGELKTNLNNCSTALHKVKSELALEKAFVESVKQFRNQIESKLTSAHQETEEEKEKVKVLEKQTHELEESRKQMLAAKEAILNEKRDVLAEKEKLTVTSEEIQRKLSAEVAKESACEKAKTRAQADSESCKDRYKALEELKDRAEQDRELLMSGLIQERSKVHRLEEKTRGLEDEQASMMVSDSAKESELIKLQKALTASENTLGKKEGELTTCEEDKRGMTIEIDTCKKEVEKCKIFEKKFNMLIGGVQKLSSNHTA